MKKKNFELNEEPAKYFNLEDRTLKYAKDTLAFLKKVNRSIENQEFIKQLARSSSSVGANYIEANNYLGKKDFAHRIGICKKEAKESGYWLKLIDIDNKKEDILGMHQSLLKETNELVLIFAAILRKVKP
ncbi:MAG: hypothetical protein A2452_09140 [Candidatus Firestonebacteria bacterium RIFOXYC2_FULL_39_67]|nr:MAG: hypothetical protein A2536_08415 [Candidatus Firestonebacteria bacterium RIFOXYD2_FULL_39_29]OGF55910.1 MAG: hypothetical protein A2452_09140 [Candidatus Firestonebacteria bacterium RIFOXYC2_FULL_39_67]